MDDVKIQINSKEALDRLIGPDPGGKFALEIRDNVASWFAEKYFKSLLDKGVFQVTTDMKRELAEAKAKMIDDAIVDLKRSTNWGTLTPELKEGTKNLIEKAVMDHVEKCLRTAVNIQSDHLIARAKTMLENKLEDYIKQTVYDQVRTQVTAQLASVITHLTSLSGWASQELKTKKAEDRKIELSL